MIIIAILMADLGIFVSIWLSTSSYIEPSNKVKFVSLMETFDPETLCPFCRVIRLPQSRHCNICNRCVERYDHHCPWINNCVGRTNHSRFYVHLILILAYCAASLVNAIVSLAANGDNGDTNVSTGLFRANSELFIPEALIGVSHVTLLALGLLFGVLVLALFVYQTQNLVKGVTSTERIRRARLLLNNSTSIQFGSQ